MTATVRLYLGGKIDQWYARQDQGGVVFVMDVDNVEEAERLLHGLPLGASGLLTFDLIPLGPIRALDALLPK